MIRRRTEIALVAVFSIVLALFLHRELLAGWGAVLPGEPGSDVYRAHWSAWLVARELPGWPFTTELVHFPTGVDVLPFPALSLVAVSPLTWMFGVDVSVPVLVISYSALAVVSGWFLVRTLGGGLGGGILAGSLIATQPILGGSLRDGTLEILAVAWLPFGLAAFYKAVKGERRWGIIAGLIAVCVAMESAYYASFSAVAFLVLATQVRSKEGMKAVGLALGVSLVGAGLLASVFWPVLENARHVLAGTGDDMGSVRSGNAASLDVLLQLAMSPGSRGWRVSDLYGPPLAHWLTFLVGSVLVLRRHAWLVVLGLLYVLLAMDHGLLSFWSDSPVGSIVRFPRRYLAVSGVAFSAASGLAVTAFMGRARLEWLAGGALSIYLGLWGAHAGGWVKGYPTTPIPETPQFAQVLAEDSEECSALLLPVELPVVQSSGMGERKRSDMPVFAEISRAISSSDQLFIQTRTHKSGRYAPSLVTLARQEGGELELAKNITDLARSTVGESVPNSARAPSAVYLDEMRWLMGLGLKYIVVDEARYGEEELLFLRELLGKWAVEERVFEDGTGVRMFKLYEERPSFVAAPQAQREGVPTGFGGRVLDHLEQVGRIEVVLDLGDRQVSCPVGPESGEFLCGGVHEYQRIWVTVEDTAYSVERRGTLTQATVRILKPLELE
ncbi:MAG: hypothetical protein VX519_02355 [Myxococcota bacterium]|nr:hypothetical protein [Myxococcota bacterium]